MPSSLVPELLGDVVRRHAACDRTEANALWESVLPLLLYETRHCGLSAAKIAFEAGGVIASSHVRAPFAPLSPEIAAKLLELARARDIFALRWA
jgi:4-hydroxy-tetrahydrodipicolinate synthase